MLGAAATLGARRVLSLGVAAAFPVSPAGAVAVIGTGLAIAGVAAVGVGPALGGQEARNSGDGQNALGRRAIQPCW